MRCEKPCDDLRAFCAERDVDLDALGRLQGLRAGRRREDAPIEMLMVDDDEKIAFLSRAVARRPALQGDPPRQARQRVQPHAGGLEVPRRWHRRLHRAADVSGVLGRVEQLLDESVAAHEYLIPESDAEALFDLGAVDWKGLEEAFKQGRPRTAAQRLRSLLSARITALSFASTRYASTWSSGSRSWSPTTTPAASTPRHSSRSCLNFSKKLTEEEARSLSEGLTEEQLAIFDLLMRPRPNCQTTRSAQVKRVAEELLAVLKRDKIVLDWRKEQSTRAAVRVAVEETLDRLPEKFTRQLYAQKCDAVYQHVFDSYWDDGHSVYDEAA